MPDKHDVAPDFEVPDDQGHPRQLSAYRGRWVVLYFVITSYSIHYTKLYEAFDVGILPRTTRGNVDRPTALLCQPALDLFGDQFRTIIAANVLGLSID